MSVNFGPRYYAEGPSGGLEWGLRFTFTLFFPELRKRDDDGSGGGA
jgi:hypothetical protein